jgi:TM2 domain-containing membrane protein YozV
VIAKEIRDVDTEAARRIFWRPTKAAAAARLRLPPPRHATALWIPRLPTPRHATTLGYPGQPTPYFGYPAPSYNIDPAAPYGRDPATGEPLSDKSALAAGLLQIFFGLFGIGRFYIGSPVIGAIQLGLMFLSAMFMIVFIGFFMMFGLALWVLIDGILMICGVVKGGNGRKLRPAGN